jgi:HlyD family secretion protein
MAKQRRLGSQTLGWLIALAAVAAPVVFLMTREEAVEVTAVTVTRGEVEETITAISSGTVKPKQDSLVAAASLGTVVQVACKEGDRVTAGDVLIVLKHDELEAQKRLAEANLKVGQSRLAQAELGAEIYQRVADTEVTLRTKQKEDAEKTFERVNALFEKGGIATQNKDQAELALTVAEKGVEAALSRQEETRVREEEVKMATATIEQLQAAVAVTEATRDNAFVKAPFDGIVARINSDLGEAVTMGMPLLQLVDTSELYVEAPFDEANAAQIELGQRVRINLDAYRGEDFFGEVVFISPVVSINPDLSRTLNVRIHVDEGAEKFIAGMSADIMIVIRNKEDVVFAPTEALIRQEYAYVVDNGRARRRDITTGVGNWNTMEILKGLEEGDQLITSVSLSELEDGVKVRVVEKLES